MAGQNNLRAVPAQVVGTEDRTKCDSKKPMPYPQIKQAGNVVCNQILQLEKRKFIELSKRCEKEKILVIFKTRLPFANDEVNAGNIQKIGLSVRFS